MINNGLLSWQQANGFRQESNSVYGVYNGIGFAVSGEDGGKLFTFMLTGSDSAFDRIEDILAAERSPLGEVQVGDVENYLALFFEEISGEMPASLMTALLDFVIAHAHECGFTVPRVCVKCGAPANKRSFYNNMVQPMCAACRDEEAAKRKPTSRPAPHQEAPAAPTHGDTLLTQKVRYNPDEDDTYSQYTHENTRAPQPKPAAVPQPHPQQPRQTASVPLGFAPVDDSSMGDKAKGILGALLGAVAGLVPLYLSAIISSASISLAMYVLCAGAGIGAVLGYISFGGYKLRNTALVSTIALAEIFSIISFVCINMIAGMGGGLTAGEALSSSLFKGVVDYLNIALAVFSSALGVFVTLDPLSKYIGADYYGK